MVDWSREIAVLTFLLSSMQGWTSVWTATSRVSAEIISDSQNQLKWSLRNNWRKQLHIPDPVDDILSCNPNSGTVVIEVLNSGANSSVPNPNPEPSSIFAWFRPQTTAAYELDDETLTNASLDFLLQKLADSSELLLLGWSILKPFSKWFVRIKDTYKQLKNLTINFLRNFNGILLRPI